MRRARWAINKFIYGNDTELTNNRYKKSQNYFIIQAVFATAFTVLTGGVILSGFAVHIGASDQIVGFISLFPNIAGMMMIFSSFILERFKKRKKFVISVVLIAKLMVCSIILIPLILPDELQVTAVAVVLFVAYALNSINGVAINIWFISVVPENIRGRYFGLRQMFALVVSLMLPPIAGIVMDATSKGYIGFSILFCAAIIMVVGESMAYKKIEEPEEEISEPLNLKLKDVLTVPLKNKKFMNYLFRVCFFYMVAFLSATFTSVYMLRYLKLSYTFINTLSMFGAALQMLCYRIWGRISDKLGHEFVMKTSLWFFVLEFALWAVMPKGLVHVIMPIAYIFSAIANSGYALSIFNNRYSIIPIKGRSVYEGFYGATLGIVFLVSPIIGGGIKTALESSSIVSSNIQFGQFRILYAISAVGMILLQALEWREKRSKDISTIPGCNV